MKTRYGESLVSTIYSVFASELGIDPHILYTLD